MPQLDIYATRKQNSMMRYFPLSSHVCLILYNPLWLGKHYFCSALPGGAPCADGQPLCSHPTKLPCILHRKPWSPEVMQLIKSVCFSTFQKIFFAFQERREEFPWNLPSALSKLAHSRHCAATSASPLSSF